MNRTEILSKLNNLFIPKEKYWVSGGAALVLHNVKHETTDIDLGCSSDNFDFYCSSYSFRISMEKRICKIDNCIEIIEDWNADSFINIDGFKVASLESIIKQKEILGRPKDYDDIKMIRNYLKNGCNKYQ